MWVSAKRRTAKYYIIQYVACRMWMRWLINNSGKRIEVQEINATSICNKKILLHIQQTSNRSIEANQSFRIYTYNPSLVEDLGHTSFKAICLLDSTGKKWKVGKEHIKKLNEELKVRATLQPN